ncbi:unnamed protein product [Paramecium pentaurelia]|uniref:EGF-like domain-containing protein n=1 Tax=Paramecium pentaurelia TaxID=43138 RepID=A0A8S1XCD4_9CILI|nr:unnamed protein product [Paramecium pentaurelia]
MKILILILIWMIECQGSDYSFIQIMDYNQEFDSIRIKVYTKKLDKDNPNHKLFKKLIKSASHFTEDTYKVKRSKNNIVLNVKQCHHIKVPKQHRKKGIKNADFILYVTETDIAESWIAKSSPCLYDQNYRPVAGQIILNNYHFQKNLNELDKYERLGTIVHEFTHTLGFHRRIIDHFNMTEMIQDKLYLKSPGIIEYAKQYFNCSSLQYLPLEDDGGPTAQFSHFEKMTFNQEIMTGTASRDTVYSKFTMLVLQDTGIYQANLNKAGRYEWGMNQGCLAAQGGCDSPTICKLAKNERFCSYNYQHIQFCKPSQKLAECGLVTALTDCNKKRCFNYQDSSTLLHKAKCFKSKCTSLGIRVKYKGEVQYCQSDFATISFNDQIIQCPVFKDFCNDYSLCNNRGKLIDGKCQCDLGFKGKKCKKLL